MPLSPAVFAILSRLVAERSGLRYTLADRELLAGKVSPRAEELGFGSLLDYYYFLRYDPRGDEELELLLEALVNHETYFFRETEQLGLLIDTFLAPMVRSGQRPRVWCSAASSGEEPYTLAMILAERELLERVELLASDLSRQALAQAQRAVYSGRALRAASGPLADRWLELQGEKVQVAPLVRNAVSWQRVNLVDAGQVEGLGAFDAILCRNVLIYFDDETTRRVLAGLTAALKAGGLLLVGAAESLIQYGTALGCEERAGSFFYRKAA